MFSKWTRSVRRVGSESWELVRLALEPPRDLRQVLLQQARTSNQTAASLLHAQKELNLLKYHGFSQYIRQKSNRLRISTTTRSQSTEDQSNTIAKIPFLITTTMKQELAELKYDESAIKLLTPLQAGLILEHQLPPNQPERLAVLEQEAARIQQQQQEQLAQDEKEKAKLAEQQELIHSKQQDVPAEFTKASNFSFFSANLLNHTDAPREWFQVIDAKNEVIGLFPCEEEAVERIEIEEGLPRAQQSPANCGFRVQRVLK